MSFPVSAMVDTHSTLHVMKKSGWKWSITSSTRAFDVTPKNSLAKVDQGLFPARGRVDLCQTRPNIPCQGLKFLAGWLVDKGSAGYVFELKFNTIII